MPTLRGRLKARQLDLEHRVFLWRLKVLAVYAPAVPDLSQDDCPWRSRKRLCSRACDSYPLPAGCRRESALKW